MFTGLVEELGTIRRVNHNSEGRLFDIKANKALERMKVGDSIAVDGACLSAVSIAKDGFTAQAVRETINRSTLKYFKAGTVVNLERAMSAEGRFGGHFVQGHVDGVGVISSLSMTGKAGNLSVELGSDLMKYIVMKGSVTVNGISLTVAALSGNLVSVSVIPLTMRDTNLKMKKKGDYVNIEVDMLAKYIEKFIVKKSDDGIGITEKIKHWGYENR